MESTNLWLPTVPMSLIDAINRAAAAQGSFRYAMAASDADYNGHWVTIDQGIRPRWRAHYMWGGTQWLTRGATVEEALRVGFDEHKRGAKGCTVVAHGVPAEAVEYARSLGYVDYSHETADAHNATYRDARFDEIGMAMMCERQLGCPAVGFLANSATIEEYKAKVDAFFASRKRRGKPMETPNLDGMTYGAVAAKSPTLIIIKAEDVTFRIRLSRGDGKTKGIKALRARLINAIQENVNLSGLTEGK